MEQGTKPSSSEQSSLFVSATEDEVLVSEFLLELRTIMSLSESLSKFNWGRKRRRSCLDEAPQLAPAPSPLSPSVQRTDDKIEERRLHIKGEEDKAVAGTTASPNTPLCFPPSESDERPKHSSKHSSKKWSKLEYIDMIEELNQRKELFRGEIEKVKRHYNKLKSHNSELKALVEENFTQLLNTCPRKEAPQMEVGMNLGEKLTKPQRITRVPHQKPLIADPTVQNIQFAFGPITTQTNNGIGSVNHVGPTGIDLNISAEEAFGVEPSQPLDVSRDFADKRIRFAEARRRRRGIIKIKNTRS